MTERIDRLTKQRLTYRIVWYEATAFLLLIVFMWIEEILDIPYLLVGSPATPVNWTEVVMETIVIGVLGTFFCYRTWRFIQRIKYLEGFLPVCLFCKKIRIEETWIAIEEYLSQHSEAIFSHGLCPDCAREQYGYTDTDDSGKPANEPASQSR